MNAKFGKIVYRVDPEDGKVLGYFNYYPWDHYEYGIMTGLAFEFPDGTGN
ncbi:MAG: hypothetical protein JSW52_07225 [Candidatus Coatesbacteria bacterium]|nr:MAG: hypothetical protein JSW52_07225 [Candidatus Coatesbacteria bacterium]